MDRFNIEYDDVLREGVEKLSSLREDTYNRGFREGKEEGKLEGKLEGSILSISDMILFLMKDRGWSVEEAIRNTPVPKDLIEPVRAEVNRRTGC